MTESTQPPTDARGAVTRLRGLLGGPDAEWLVLRVRDRIAHGRTGRLSGTVQLRQPTEDERTAAQLLLGVPGRSTGTLHVDLGELDDALRRGLWPAGLADAVTVLTGPVSTWPRERAAVDAAWVHAAAGFTPALLAHPALESWWVPWCAAGGLRTWSGADPVAGRRLAADAAACLCALPSVGEPLAVLARRITGDARALDRSRPLTSLVLAALAAPHALDPADTEGPASTAAPRRPLDEPSSPRALWASAGILSSTVSATALCLGVPPDPFAGARGPAEASATATALAAWRAALVPVVLTLDQIRSGGVGVVPADGIVHVCASPNVVEAVATEAAGRARRGGLPPAPSGVPVLVCTDGRPGAAVLELLERLSGAGAEVRFHGDFDWDGLRIAELLTPRIPWTPWRFTAPDYERAIADRAVPERAVPERAVPELTPPAGRQVSLRGTPAPSPWDPALAEAMATWGVAVEEDEVAGRLVADLLG